MKNVTVFNPCFGERESRDVMTEELARFKVAEGHRLKYCGKWKWTKTRTILKNYVAFLLCKYSPFSDPESPKEVQVSAVGVLSLVCGGVSWAALLVSHRWSRAFTLPEERQELSRNIFQFFGFVKKSYYNYLKWCLFLFICIMWVVFLLLRAQQNKNTFMTLMLTSGNILLLSQGPLVLSRKLDTWF